MFKGFYFITDSSLSRAGIISDVKKACCAGVCAVQYRNKNSCVKEILKEALRLRKVCRKIPLIINDRVDIALAVKADGVHLGQKDMPVNLARRILGKNKIIGLTVHSLSQAEEGMRYGVDYLGVSPVFSTKTKADSGKPVGLELIARIRKKYDIPLVAIGGIKLGNARDVIRSGADSLSAISAVLIKADIKAEITRFCKEIRLGLASRGVL